MDEVDLKDYLKKTDDEFSKLLLEHQTYELQLKELIHRPYLNQEDQLLESVIKKKKLALKDQMQMIIRRHHVETRTG